MVIPGGGRNLQGASTVSPSLVPPGAVAGQLKRRMSAVTLPTKVRVSG
jgi:hypothetical protein